MDKMEEKYGKPDYEAYPMLGYSYSVLARILDEKEQMKRNNLDEAVSLLEYNGAIEYAQSHDSHLDSGYMVYTVIQDKKPVHIGIYGGKRVRMKRRHNPISDVKKKYGDGCVFLILEYGLSQRQALSVQQTLKRRITS